MTQLCVVSPRIGVVLVTPSTAQGQVDYPAFSAWWNTKSREATSFLVVLGTTGETPTLSTEEQHRVVDFVLEVNARRLPVVVGVTGNATLNCVNELQHGMWTAWPRSWWRPLHTTNPPKKV